MFLGVTHKNFQAIHMYSLTLFVHLDFGLSGTDSERRRIMKRLGIFLVGFCVGLCCEIHLNCEKE